MKKIILLGLLTIFACSEKNNTLNKEEIFLNKINSATNANLSVDELPGWLQAKVNDIKESETPLIEAKLLQCDWNNQNVYHIWCNFYSCLLCETYNNSGEKIVFDNEQKSEDFINKSENWQLLWTNIEDGTIPFIEYSLTDTKCQWTNLNYDNSVIVINSKTELENYITCTEGTFPEIDFSKYTLVLASGVSSSNVGSIHTALFKYSDTEYELNITVYRGLLAIMEPWCVSIITSKIPDTVKINLKPDYVTL